MLRRAHATIGLLIALLCLAAPASAQSEPDWAPETFTLSNGLRAVVLPDHRVPIITHTIWYRVGSSDETPGKTGLAHFLEHLMFKATSTSEAGAFSRTVARNGGQDNAGTHYDFTYYYFRVAKDRLSTIMALEADRMVNLRLGDDEVVAERSVVQEERRQVVESSAAAVLDEKVWAELYAGHPYAAPVIGHMNEVAALTREDAIDWYRTWYGPENAILVVAGDITAAELKPLAETVYGKIAPRGNLKARTVPAVKALSASAEVSHADPKVRQPVWSRNWLGVPIGHADAAALRVGMQVLGGGRTSRLYGALVERGIAVAATAYALEMEAAGPVTLSVSPAPGVPMETAREQALKVTRDFLRQGPTAKELERAKKIVAASDIYRRDNQMDMARHYGALLTAGLSLEQIDALDERVASVSADEVRAAMNRYLSGKHHVDGSLLPVTR